MSNVEEKTKREQVYEVKGIPIHAYLIETGEFRWTPASEACGDRQNAKKILEVLKKMPEDRRAVWASRLDSEHAKARCPVIRDDPGLCQEFDAFCAAYDRSQEKSTNTRKEGEKLKNE